MISGFFKKDEKKPENPAVELSNAEIFGLKKEILALKAERDDIQAGNVKFLAVKKEEIERLVANAKQLSNEANEIHAQAQKKAKVVADNEEFINSRLAEITAKSDLLEFNTKQSKARLVKLEHDLMEFQNKMAIERHDLELKENVLNARRVVIDSDEAKTASMREAIEKLLKDASAKVEYADKHAILVEDLNQQADLQLGLLVKRDEELDAKEADVKAREIAVSDKENVVFHTQMKLKEDTLSHKALVAEFAVRAGKVKDAEERVAAEKDKLEKMKQTLLGGN